MDEIWNVIGFRKVSFEDKQSRQRVEGYSLFLTRPGSGDNMSGDECQKLFISSQYVPYIPYVGDTVQLVYNRYGKIASIATV